MDSFSQEFSQVKEGEQASSRMSAMTSKTVVIVGGLALVAVVLAPAAASFHGLVGFGQDMLDLHGGWEYLVPITLDGAALYAAALSLRAILLGDSAGGSRFLVALYALGSAGFNAGHALYSVNAAGGVPAAGYFAGMSLSAVVLWEATLRQLRRQQLRELGALPAELPKFRLLRWVLAPLETPRVWRHAVLNDITQPTEALSTWRAERMDRKNAPVIEQTPSPRAIDESTTSSHDENGASDECSRGVPEEHGQEDSGLVTDDRSGVLPGQRTGTGSIDGQRRTELGTAGSERGNDVHGPADGSLTTEPEPESEVVPDPELVGMNKADAVRHAFAEIDREDVPAALEWLAARGVLLDRSYGYDVLRRMKRSRAKTETNVIELRRTEGGES